MMRFWRFCLTPFLVGVIVATIIGAIIQLVVMLGPVVKHFGDYIVGFVTVTALILLLWELGNATMSLWRYLNGDV